MKNKLFKFFLINLLICNISFADQFKFETSEIELIDGGDLIYAKNGRVQSVDGDLEVEAEAFTYTKNPNILKAFRGDAYFKSDNLTMEFDEITINQSTLITTAKYGVKIINLEKDISIETDSIIYDKNKELLKSNTSSIFKDKIGNIIKSNKFQYNLNSGILKLEKANLKDISKNIYNVETAFLNTNSNKLIGKDISIDLNNKSFNKNNEPRIKGKSINYQNNMTKITKGVFTTCKKTNTCPAWQLTAEEVNHDRKKKVINYKNALLKVYDIPVMYFPRFFHPDPTVKRKSGFLMPTIKNSPNSNNFLSVPYFFAISQSKDITFTPRFYDEDKFLFQSEFRQENENSSHISDFSIFNEKDKDTKTHFFYNFGRSLEFSYFEDSDLTLKVEKTSNDTYLRKNKLLSPIINSFNNLENTLSLNLYSSNLSINSEIKAYENLDKNKSDRYEYVLPKFDIIKLFDNKTNLDGNFLFKSNNFVRSYETNILEKVNINNFLFNSNPKVTNTGFYNSYDFIFKNVNTNGQNSNEYKESDNFYLSGLFQYNASLPLIKENNGLINILKPKMALKLSPDYTKDLSKNDGNRLDVNNIYNLERLSKNEVVEGGTSLTLGNDFTIVDKEKSKEKFGIKLATNMRFKENADLPKNNQLGAKTSNFFGEILFNPNDFIKTSYNASTKNNLTDINYENFVTEFSLNNFVTTFDYLNENHSETTSSYLSNSTRYSFNNSNSLKFSTRENKSSNLTEYYNLIYEYKNDCLAASIEYNKDYYDDRDIKPEENIFLKLTIIPFGQSSSPDLKK
mgnify:CR=1 FL=1